MVRGADPSLANQYVMIGAHYDHIGYLQFGLANTPNTPTL